MTLRQAFNQAIRANYELRKALKAQRYVVMGAELGNVNRIIKNSKDSIPDDVLNEQLPEEKKGTQ